MKACLFGAAAITLVAASPASAQLLCGRDGGMLGGTMGGLKGSMNGAGSLDTTLEVSLRRVFADLAFDERIP
jgi:hypothetical protein